MRLPKRWKSSPQVRSNSHFGALYPVLHKLEADGHIEIEVEYIGKRVRKYYTLTETGRSWTDQKVDEFFDFVNTLSYVLKPTPA